MQLKRFFFGFSATALASLALAANPVVVNSGGSGDFTTVQAAISSWTTGGSNASETAPFVIRVTPGTYDEMITLDSLAGGFGNIVGDIVIESTVPGTNPVLKLKAGIVTAGAADDGLFINQDEHDVTIRDMTFTRSISNTAETPLDELVRIDETGPNATMNLVSFYNCVFTEVNEAGEPMATDKQSALLPPVTRGGPARIAGARLLQSYGDAGESLQLIIDNCVFYAGASSNVTAYNDGAGEEFVQIHNSLSAWAGYTAFEVGGNNPDATLTITGNDQTAGPLDCTAAINPLLGGHGIHINRTVQGHTSNISGVLVSSKGTESTPPGLAASRGISGGNSTIETLTDAIIEAPSYGIVDISHGDSVWERVTIHSPGTTILYTGTATAGSLTVRDSIISGGGTKFPSGPPGDITYENVGFPTSGPYANADVGVGMQVESVNDDPAYVSLDPLSPDYFDVAAPEYANVSSEDGPLAGGADYVGPTSDVSNWSVY